MIYLGGLFRGNTRTDRNIYISSLCSISFPYLENSLSRDAFKFIERYIYFNDNNNCKQPDKLGFDLLYKVQYILNILQKGLQKAWIARENIIIDESMIIY